MSNNTNNMTIRIDKDSKESADTLFKNLGTNTNSAINMFIRQCITEQRLVFTPSMAPTPSKELLASLQEIEDYKNEKVKLPTFDTTKELFDYLNN